MTPVITLPSWASFRLKDDNTLLKNKHSTIVDVNGPEMYEAYFDEFRELYNSGHGDFRDAEGNLKEEWQDALDDLMGDTPSAYWCEVAYQCMKLDLQMACRTFALNISVHDPVKSHSQKVRPMRRDPKHAAGAIAKDGQVVARGTEARQHFKRLRGFIPS